MKAFKVIGIQPYRMEFSRKEFFEHSWTIIDKYFGHNKGYQLIKHMLDSYNDFIMRKLDNIIDGFNPIEIHHQHLPEEDKFKYSMSIEVKNPIISKPMIFEKDGSTKITTPMDARNRNFTYSAPLYVDVHITVSIYDQETKETAVEQKKINNVCLGKIPIMVNSKYCVLHENKHYNTECPYDFGGYFIINGNEKVIISQDRIAENKTYVFVSNKPGPYSHVAEIRSVQENKFSVPKTTSLKLSAKPNQFGRFIRANIHHIKHDVPIFVLFRALGVETDMDIVKLIVYDLEDQDNKRLMNELVGSVEEANAVTCTREAFEYLSRHMNINGYPREILTNKQHRLEILKNVLRNEFLPHVGTCFAKKALYLGYMVNKLLKCYLGLLPYDDRDSYINKRIDTPGILLANLFRQCYGKVIKDMRNAIQKDINAGSWRATNRFMHVINKVNIAKLMKSTTIESALKYGLATGNWGIKNKAKAGVAQVLNRLTYNSSISHLRRINTPIEKTGKLVQPRKLHSTQWGIICPAECFDPETPILMWSGEIKKAKEIVVGDYLIDDKGNAVRVRSTCKGLKTMYEIIPDKKNFMGYTVTDNHILTLKARMHTRNPTKKNKKYTLRRFNTSELRYVTESFDSIQELEAFKSEIDDTVDMTIQKYLSLPMNVQKELYMFKSSGINWEHKEVALDPYILGMWLGDGMSHGYGFVTADKELLDKWIEWGKGNDATIKKGHKYKYGISSTTNNTQHGISCNKTEQAPLKKLLAKYGLVNNKHIPHEYLVNDRKTRLAVMAGLVDTDGNVRANGHEIRICQGERNYKLIYDAEFLARSLGFSCHMNHGMCTYTVNKEKRQKPYKELTITGPKLYEIPTVLPRKKLNKFDNPISIKKGESHMQSSFKLVPKPLQEFVGWQLEGNGRFLMGDMSISHNTPEGVSVGLVKNMSLISNITISSNSTTLRELLGETDIIMYDGTNIGEFSKGTKVIVNGDIIGVHHKPNELYDTLKGWKRRGMVNVYTGVYWNVYRNEIWVCTEGGRCVRPCYIVENNQVGLTGTLVKKIESKEVDFSTLVIGCEEFPPMIEYLDVEECNQSMIAMKYADLFKGMKGSTYPVRYTHLELDASLMLGVLAASIPFSNHNQAPRNCYQCLWIEEDVLMADGTKKKIKDVKVGDEVVSFDTKTMKPGVGKVINQYVRTTDKDIYKITLESGRSLIATSNHPLMSPKGWVKVEDMKVGETAIGVYTNNMTSVPFTHNVDDVTTILNKESFNNALNTLNVNPTLITKHAYILEQLGLLPMQNNNNHLPTIARLCGYIITDGSLNIYNKKHGGVTPQVQANFGSELDAQLFEDDVEYLGFDRSAILYQCREIHGSTHKTYKISHNGAFASLILAMDIHHGNKVNNARKPLPSWIMNGSDLVKHEFMAGFQGGDGNQVYNAKGTNRFYTLPIYQSIVPQHEESLITFMKQIQALYEDLGVDTIEVKRMSTVNQQYGKYKIGVYLENNPNNFVKIMERVGYRYCDKKSAKTAVINEYIKSGSLVMFDEWQSKVARKGYSIFVPIAKIEKQANCLISDITVEGNHSFITSHGIMSSNSAMGKQAIGIYTSNYLDRYDTLGHVLNYPQVPFVQTRASKIVNNDKLPCGMNVIVAIMTYTGYNQEDSVIMNKSAVDRGMFGSTHYRTYKEQNNKNHSTGEEEYFCKPDLKTTKQFKPYNYDKLNKDGFVEENTYVESGDIIIGKCMPQKNGNIITNKDTSVVLKNNEKGFIDRNCYGDKHFTNINGDGYTFAKVRIRSDRIPCIGDKFCLPGDCEVLTEGGWTRIDDLYNTRGNVKVAQLMEDGTMVYEYPTNTVMFDHDGDMYSARGPHVNVLATMEHKMYVRDQVDGRGKLVMARDLVGNKSWFVKDGDWKVDNGGDYSRIVNPCFGLDNIVDCAKVFGAWMRRGWVDVTNKTITISSVKGDTIVELCNIFHKNKVDYVLLRDDEVLVKSLAMYEYINIAQGNVQFPFWLECNCNVARAFVQAFVQDDQTKVLGRERADHLCVLALYAGYSADVVDVCNNGRAYTVRVNVEPYLNTSDYVEEIVQFKGRVYCIEVPSHVFYIRYKGITMWTGNSSRHGQKGTVGMMYRQEDMPFTGDGIVPDIIVNPHAIPSRMTIAQLMECIMGKACATLGTFGDATPFTDVKVEDIAQALEHSGLERYGNEILYNSRTGEQMQTEIFIGPTYYQRLKHMVFDKVHSRAQNGPVVMLTRQPAEGRARDGGLRLGEMEIECNWAHGTMQFLKERFMECSDNYRVFVCKKCGMMANVNPDKGIYSCKPCKNITNFSEIRIPYSCKLLFQEIQTMGIAAKFLT